MSLTTSPSNRILLQSAIDFIGDSDYFTTKGLRESLNIVSDSKQCNIVYTFLASLKRLDLIYEVRRVHGSIVYHRAKDGKKVKPIILNQIIK